MMMKTIKLKSLALVNFKGIANMEIDFSDRETWITGDNGTGKTTVFDSFLWLLFGKDSTWRSDNNFNIKTLDDKGNPILHLEHSVTGILDVDGKEVKLSRSYVEVWAKPRNRAEEVLKNHKTEFAVNGVKMGTKSEYDEVVSSIIDESVFKLITDPYYFAALKPDVQKSILFDMAGNVSDEDVAKTKPEYSELLDRLTGRTLEQYAKEMAAKKKAINDELKVIPSQIDTANRLMPEAEDWAALESEIAAKKKAVADIDAQIADKSQINENEYKRKSELQKELNDKRLALAKRQADIKGEAMKDVNAKTLDLQKKEYEIRSLADSIQRWQERRQNINLNIAAINDDLAAMRAEYRKINAETLEYPQGAFVCPTCHRPLEIDDIEEKQREMQANFNADKAKRLEKNKNDGKAKKQRMDELTKEVDDLSLKIKTSEQQVGVMKEDYETMKSQIPQAPDTDAMIRNDATCVGLENDIAELANQMGMEFKPADTTELESGKAVLQDALQELYKRLANREQISRIHKEIEELEDRRRANNVALAELERIEDLAFNFQKDKDAELTRRINGLFKVVSFTFTREQLNGNEKLACICTVNGTPYPDVNTAGKVNAGVDIINAICKAKGVCAPLFIDNRERVNSIIPTVSQIINLKVSTDKQLTIKSVM